MKRGRREVRVRRITVSEANDELGVDMEAAFWEALVRFIAYPELVYDAKSQTISFPSYVPFRQLAEEWLEGIEQGIHDIRLCEVCEGYFDLDQSEGIFGRPELQEEFICIPCAESMTAKDYYERFIERI